MGPEADRFWLPLLATGLGAAAAVPVVAAWMGVSMQALLVIPLGARVLLCGLFAVGVIWPFAYCIAAACLTDTEASQRRGLVALVLLGAGLATILGGMSPARAAVASAFAIPGALAADSLRRMLLNGDTLSVTSQWGGLGGGLGGWRCSRSLSMLAVLCLACLVTAAVLYAPDQPRPRAAPIARS